MISKNGETFSLPINKNTIYCANCGKELHPPFDITKKIGQKTYCEECYNQKKNINLSWGSEEEKRRLYDFIKEIFSIDEIPQLWIEQIAKICKEDPKKNYTNLYYTLKYAVKIEEITPNPLYGIKGIVTQYYDKAAEYYRQLQKVLDHNEQTVIENKKIVVQIPRPVVKDTKNLTKIEDL